MVCKSNTGMGTTHFKEVGGGARILTPPPRAPDKHKGLYACKSHVAEWCPEKDRAQAKYLVAAGLDL